MLHKIPIEKGQSDKWISLSFGEAVRKISFPILFAPNYKKIPLYTSIKEINITSNGKQWNFGKELLPINGVIDFGEWLERATLNVRYNSTSDSLQTDDNDSVLVVATNESILNVRRFESRLLKNFTANEVKLVDFYASSKEISIAAKDFTFGTYDYLMVLIYKLNGYTETLKLRNNEIITIKEPVVGLLVQEVNGQAEANGSVHVIKE